MLFQDKHGNVWDEQDVNALDPMDIDELELHVLEREPFWQGRSRRMRAVDEIY